MDADEDQVIQGITSTAAFTLTISGEEAAITVTTTHLSATCPVDSQCQFAFIGGSALTIKPKSTKNLADCAKFGCAGINRQEEEDESALHRRSSDSR